jgi:hypothetical protein
MADIFQSILTFLHVKRSRSFRPNDNITILLLILTQSVSYLIKMRFRKHSVGVYGCVHIHGCIVFLAGRGTNIFWCRRMLLWHFCMRCVVNHWFLMAHGATSRNIYATHCVSCHTRQETQYLSHYLGF